MANPRFLYPGSNPPSRPAGFGTRLSGAALSPPIPTPAQGVADVTFHADSDSVTVFVEFDRLASGSTMAHLHGPAPQKGILLELPQFPRDVRAGRYVHTLSLRDPASYSQERLRAVGLLGARELLLAALFSGRAVVNVHSHALPDGEIAGRLRRNQ
jgi:hypothetical protein